MNGLNLPPGIAVILVAEDVRRLKILHSQGRIPPVADGETAIDFEFRNYTGQIPLSFMPSFSCVPAFREVYEAFLKSGDQNLIDSYITTLQERFEEEQERLIPQPERTLCEPESDIEMDDDLKENVYGGQPMMVVGVEELEGAREFPLPPVSDVPPLPSFDSLGLPSSAQNKEENKEKKKPSPQRRERKKKTKSMKRMKKIKKKKKIKSEKKRAKKRHICPYCSKEMSSKSSLKRHIAWHTGDYKHKCMFCNKKYYDQPHLDYHIRTHTGERPHQCRYCEKTFNWHGALTKHEVVHTGEEPYECDACGERFKQRPQLNRHCMQAHNIKLKRYAHLKKSKSRSRKVKKEEK